MNPEPATSVVPAIPAAPSARDAPCIAAAEPRSHSPHFERLFRHTLKAGEVNPLLLIVPLYRQETVA